MPTSTLTEDDWGTLLDRIRDGECTPFLGAGACCGNLPLGREVATEWAQKYAYPLDDKEHLPRVAQYLAIRSDRMRPKEKLLEAFRSRVGTNTPDFRMEDELHGVLADLPIPVYLTTNYDPFMKSALQSRNRGCEREYCRWNESLRRRPTIFEHNYEPTKDRPLVYHLHGYDELAESLVLTEDDYLDFLVSFAQNQLALLPNPILRRVAETTLLFLGYSLLDLDFRTLFRSVETCLRNGIGRSHVSVQLVPVGKQATDEERQCAQDYLERYFGRLEIHMYWGTCRDFARELRTRWLAFCHAE